MDANDNQKPATGTGPAPVTGSSTGGFASQGGYGRDTVGRGPYPQPNTFSTNKADRVGPEGGSDNQDLMDRAQAANEEGQQQRAEQQEALKP